MCSKVKPPVSPLQARMIEDMTARGLQAKTQTGHIRSCRRFAKWLGRSPDTASPEDVRLFQLHLSASGTSNQTRNMVMSGVKFLFRTTLRRHDLVAEIFYVGEPQKLPPVMSREEVATLLGAAKTLKAKAMLSLAYGCGLRAGEVCRVTVGDIDSGQGIIRIIQSKGRKDRHVMLSDGLLDLLRQYWPERSKRHDTGIRPEQRYLFPGRAGPMTTRQLNRLFHEARQEAGITKPVNTRTLRHSFATHLLEAGVDVRVIQALLGHANPLSTARYTRVATGLIARLSSPIDLLNAPPDTEDGENKT